MHLVHIGVAVKDLPAVAKVFRDVLGAEPASGVIEDPEQQAVLQMFRSGSTYIELVAPASEESHVNRVIARSGEGPIHLCFETDDIDAAVASARAGGVVVFRPPVAAALFGGKRVAFGMLPNRMVVEFVEAGWQDAMPGPDG